MNLDKLIFISMITAVFIFSACTNPAEQGPAAGSSETIIDLSSPPPGSNADQAKWDTFDDTKKQESWDKYVADNSAAADSTAEAPVEEAPVERTPGSGGGGSSVIPERELAK